MFSRFALPLFAVGLVVVVLAQSLAPSAVMAATPAPGNGVNQQINFQGRLLNGAGAVVPDGSYNMRFKIYSGGDGCVVPAVQVSPCNADIEWTENRLVNASAGVTVKNGYFSVQLGSVTALPTTIWNFDRLWLSMDVGGTANSPTPTYDGEMLPFKRITSAVQALNSGLLGGLAASAFGQLAATQTFTGTNTFSRSGGAGIVLSGTPAASGSILQVGAALSSGNASGTLIGSNGAFTGDLLNLQVSNATKLKVSNAGLLDAAAGFAVNGTAGTTIATCSGGQYVSSFSSNLGIVTGGSCATPAGTYGFSAAATTGGGQTVVSGDTLTIAAGTTLRRRWAGPIRSRWLRRLRRLLRV